MCGVGYVEGKNARAILFMMLCRLDHRGPHMTGLGAIEDGVGTAEKWAGIAYTRPLDVPEYSGLNNQLRFLMDNFGLKWGDTNPLRQLVKQKKGDDEPINWVEIINSTLNDNVTQAIGHTRYTTYGDLELKYAHPQTDYRTRIKNSIWRKEFDCSHMFVFNGNVEGEPLKTITFPNFNYLNDGDTRRMMEFCRRRGAHELVEKVDAAYAFIYLNGQAQFGRDPHGMRFLSIGFGDNTFAISSESRALDLVGFDYNDFHHVAPGEVGKIVDGHLDTSIVRRLEYSPCSFEFDYFARPTTHLDGVSIREVRLELGKRMAEFVGIKSNAVMSYIPRSPYYQAIGFSQAAGVGISEIYEVLMPDRSFIQPDQNSREDIAKRKVGLTKKGRELVRGKPVYVVEDSIVRGTTLKERVNELRGAGASEVHVIVTSPPVVDTCEFGIYMHTRRELVANRAAARLGIKLEGDILYNRDVINAVSREVARELDIDSVTYMPLDVRKQIFSRFYGVYGCLGGACMKCFGIPPPWINEYTVAAT